MVGRAIWTCCLAAALAASGANAQRAVKPAPSMADVKYGEHERHVLDFWKAGPGAPTPLVVFIHGGGFRGRRQEQHQRRDPASDAGWRDFGGGAALPTGAGVSPVGGARGRPARNSVPAVEGEGMEHRKDAHRGLGSAGAQLCMYLGFHDDMAKPGSADHVERESTRLTAIATNGGQTNMDMDWWAANIPGYRNPHRERSEIYGSASDDQIRAVIKEISAFSLISRDDPSIYMTYAMAPGDSAPDDAKKAQNWMVHHVNFGVELKKLMDALDLEAHLKYPGAAAKYPSPAEFFLEKLGKSK